MLQSAAAESVEFVTVTFETGVSEIAVFELVVLAPAGGPYEQRQIHAMTFDLLG